MTQEEPKTMTSEEAWHAMALGQCVTSAGEVYRILNGHWLQSYDGRTWRERSCFDSGPYSIVPDPSQPVESEYEKDWQTVINSADGSMKPTLMLLENLLEKHYQRKGE